MRSREQVIHTCETVDRQEVPLTASVLWSAAQLLKGKIKPSPVILVGVSQLATGHHLPHIREIAAEALHYLTEG